MRITGKVRVAARAAAVRAGVAAPSTGAVVLAYHDVLPDGAPLHHYAVSLRRFREQLDLLARERVRVVPLRELSRRLRDGEDVTGVASVVFDDALVGVHQLALPELLARGWSATLHPVVDRLGSEPAWWPGSRRTMTLAELEESVSLGLDLGSHGLTHDCLVCLGDEALHASCAAHARASRT